MPVETLERSQVEQETLSLVKELLTELGAHETVARVAPDSLFDRDLGLGSLERVELLLRTEQRLGLRVPETLAQRAETPAEWVRSIFESDESQHTERPPIHQPGDAPPPWTQAESFAEVLREQAQRNPDRVQVHLLDGGRIEEITYGHLLDQAQQVADGLAASGLKRNETVAVMLPTCSDFFYAFLGIALAGGIAVPIYPPARPNEIEEYVLRQTLILRNAQVRFLISFEAVRAVSQVMQFGVPSLREVTTADALRSRAGGTPHVRVEPADTFFIQYTSGSTGNPKGVVLTHSNVLANVQGIGWAVEARPDDAVVSWLPLYHDMGLIGSWLFSVFFAFPITMMSPLAFLSRPERWLWALSDSGGTLCPAPNFAYELCSRKIQDDAMDGVDLRRWRVAINAGEPVLPDTLERFAERFAPWGFRPESYVPCYGLAESSVALTFPPINRPPAIDRICRTSFEKEGRVIPAAANETNVLRLVANGRALPEHEVRIVDESNRDVGERVQGRLLFRGPSKTGGYYRNPEATAAVVDADGWMDSGDLSYWANGEVHITGRLKDCIIKAGHNIIPQEVEAAAADVAGVRRGCVAAFGSTDPSSGTERLVVVAETRSRDSADQSRMRLEVIREVDKKVGLPPDVVELVPPQAVPKTSSGKIRRNETKRLYEQGELRPRKHPPWLQLLRLWASHFSAAIERAFWKAHDLATGRAIAVLPACMAIMGGFIARLTPTAAGSSAIVRHTVKVLRKVGGIRTRVERNGSAIGVTASLFATNRAATAELLTLVENIRGTVQISDIRLLEGLTWNAAFLLESLVVEDDEARGSTSDRLRRCVRNALASGSSVVVAADSPVGSTPQRSSFRLEPIEAAMDTGCPLIPVYAGGGNGSAIDGISSASAFLRIGDPLPLDGASCTETRQALRNAIERLMNDDRPAPTPD
ncbi:MAG: AMP-binding protein [Bryobacterales bacterium]|nr:AMP-binding protein [Bryobacterales bacterium]